uniref:NLR family member X1 isoform X1 n=1 Tax=Geotrypetes seraphini TaxID=260995 RepID=A0A6P8PKH7_GEOSA|nr:NLR family member X1 isoform X1 [Geotrypetes seraphini]XP_033775134.1 NLR family member X1 isoform X1 [Geotrypetes seraphini]
MQCCRCLPQPGTSWRKFNVLRAVAPSGLYISSQYAPVLGVDKYYFLRRSLYSPSTVTHSLFHQCHQEKQKGFLLPRSSWGGQMLMSQTSGDAIQQHKKRLAEWFSHLPNEEKQFGPSFTLDDSHVDPVIMESSLEENLKPLSELSLQNQLQTSGCSRTIAIQDVFNADANGRVVKNVVLYGTIGTGKSTLVKKLVLDWCHEMLPQYDLVIPFSCEDLSQSRTPISLKRLITKKYPHLREVLPRLGSSQLHTLFVLNSLEWLKLDFRLAETELCSDSEESVPPAAIIVNLMRKYLLPEASVIVTTRPSALGRIPSKYVDRYVKICGFLDMDLQKLYFQIRLSRQDGDASETANLMEMLSRNLEHHQQLAAACFLPSYCWLTCATLHFLYFTKATTPNQTLTGIYTSFLRLNFSGEILDNHENSQVSMMRYVAKLLGKLAYEGFKSRQTHFTEEDLHRFFEVEMKTEEELNLLTVFRSDVLNFFLTPCLQPGKEQMFVFTIPAMQEYLAALYVVLGENRTVLQRIGSEVSEAIGKAGEDITAVLNILAKFLPLRIFALFNLLKMFPRLYGKISGKNRDNIAQILAVEMFREEDAFNDDVLDQINSSILGVEGPLLPSDQKAQEEAFELFPIFMGGLLSRRNRTTLDQLGCSIKNFAAFEITKALKKHLLKSSLKKQPPSELMDFLFFLYEFQNERFTAEVVSSLKVIDLSSVRMTPLKCYVLATVLGTSGHQVMELDLTSCHMDPHDLRTLSSLFWRCKTLDLQLNSLGPEACEDIRNFLLHEKCEVDTLRLGNNPITEQGAVILGEAIAGNKSLTHLSLLHTSLGNEGVEVIATYLEKNRHLRELNLAYNSVTDQTALALVEVAKRHPTLEKVHLYFNEISEEGRQKLHGLRKEQDGVKVLLSLAEGSDVSEYSSLILNVVTSNVKGWDRERIQRHLQLLLDDLQCGRRQTVNPWKKARFLRVENQVQKVLSTVQPGNL